MGRTDFAFIFDVKLFGCRMERHEDQTTRRECETDWHGHQDHNPGSPSLWQRSRDRQA